MDLLLRTGAAGLALTRSRADQGKRVSALASGLRIANAADDPSGLAIAESLSARLAGAQRGQENVQTANNMLNVVQGAVQNVLKLLQRIRSLTVAAASDMNSAEQLQSIQTEIQALEAEINQIASTTTFNRRRLLDGSLSNRGMRPARVSEIQPAPVTGSVPTRMVANADGLGNPGTLVQAATVGNGVEAATIEISVIGYDPNAVDPITGPVGGPGLYVQVTAFSNDPSFGAGKQLTSITAVPENAGPQTAVLTSPSGSSTFFQFTLSNLTRADVGSAQAFTTYRDVPAATGSALTVNFGGTEGAVVAISIPQLSTETLGIAGINVTRPATVDVFNNPTGASNSNATAVKDAEVRATDAIAAVAATSAEIGAQTVSLEADAANSAIDQVNLSASESAVRDADIRAEAMLYTKDGVMIRISEQAIVLAQETARSFAQRMSDTIAGH